MWGGESETPALQHSSLVGECNPQKTQNVLRSAHYLGTDDKDKSFISASKSFSPDGMSVTEDSVQAIMQWESSSLGVGVEVPYCPPRVLMQDLSGRPDTRASCHEPES